MTARALHSVQGHDIGIPATGKLCQTHAGSGGEGNGTLAYLTKGYDHGKSRMHSEKFSFEVLHGVRMAELV
jgi:hypothetical protein